MVARETRVYLTGLALSITLAILAGPVLGIDLDSSVGVLVGFLFFPVLPFLLPQLYLAATGDDTERVPPAIRIRISLLLSGLLAAWAYSAAGAGGVGAVGRTVLGIVAGVLLGGLFVHEALLGYRSSKPG